MMMSLLLQTTVSTLRELETTDFLIKGVFLLANVTAVLTVQDNLCYLNCLLYQGSPLLAYHLTAPHFHTEKALKQ